MGVRRPGEIAPAAADDAPSVSMSEQREPSRATKSVPEAPSSASWFGATDAPATRSSSASPSSVIAPAAEPFTSPVLPTGDKTRALDVLDDAEVKGCVRCRLSETRTNTVFGEGDPDAQVFFIGEGPGENEDLTGRPFVGRAGQLLDKMIAAMGLRREQMFIANIVKCRPPGNRAPAPDETGACTPYLVKQLEIVRPKIIVTLGHPAARFMLDTKLSMGRLRGQWQSWRGIKLMPTFHPSYVLRSYTPEVRAAVWSDLQQVMDALGMKRPTTTKGDT
jgi:uracil-DNA glycosylase family 4